MTDKEKQIFDKYGNYNFPTDIKQSGQNIATTQIEEMAKVIESVKLYGIDNYGRKISHYSTLELAEELLKHYQPKIPEGSVVLSKEEYEELQKGVKTHNYTAMFNAVQEARITELEKRLCNIAYETRNETAREVLKIVDSKLDLYRNGVIGGSLYDDGYKSAVCEIKFKINELFNVEVKE